MNPPVLFGKTIDCLLRVVMHMPTVKLAIQAQQELVTYEVALLHAESQQQWTVEQALEAGVCDVVDPGEKQSLEQRGSF